MASVCFDYDVVFDEHGRTFDGVHAALAIIDRWRDARGRPVRAVVLQRGVHPDQGPTASIFVGRSAARCDVARHCGRHVVRLDVDPSGTLDAALPELHRLLDVTCLTPAWGDLENQIRDALASVCLKCIKGDIDALVALGSRKAGSPGAAKAVEYLQRRFRDIGYSPADIHTQEFDCTGCEQPHRTNHNVLCGRPGNRRIVLVGGHYDSTSPAGDPAPGADDNASGVAATLELARVLKDRKLSFDLVYATFGGEEVGRLGSRKCAAVARRDGWPLDLVVNLDQIGFRGEGGMGSQLVKVECDNHHGRPGNNLPSLAFAMVMMETARTYTSFKPELTGLTTSDHMSFEQEGFTCIGVAEGIRNSLAHSKDDLLATTSYVGEVTRMVLATILTLGARG